MSNVLEYLIFEGNKKIDKSGWKYSHFMAKVLFFVLIYLSEWNNLIIFASLLERNNS